MKFLCVVGVFVLLGSVTVHAGESEDPSGESSEESGHCECGRKTCAGVTGAKVIGCPNTNQFRQCTGAVCALQTCPTDQVWSFIKNSCSACDTGKHIAANLQLCACNKGTTLDSRTGTCAPCPSGATQEADRCYCPSNLALDDKNNACKACPAEATIEREDNECECNNATLFFNEDNWSCDRCPGTLVSPRRGRGSYSCKCTGPNQIFYEESVTCFTCPAGTTASRDNEKCDCAPNTGLEFDHKTGKCSCELGFTLNANGTCARSAVSP